MLCLVLLAIGWCTGLLAFVALALLVHAFYRLVRRVLHLAARLLAWYHARRRSISSTRTP